MAITEKRMKSSNEATVFVLLTFSFIHKLLFIYLCKGCFDNSLIIIIIIFSYMYKRRPLVISLSTARQVT